MLGPMFETVLITRRGEAASRVARTCRQMGLDSVIVTPGTVQDRHVNAADRTISIGEGDGRFPAERLEEIVKESKADAVHLGYAGQPQMAELARAAERADVAIVGADADMLASLEDPETLPRAAQRARVRWVDRQDRPPRAREIGVIVAADSHGATEALGECDRSLLANPKTLVQESPAPEFIFRPDGQAFRASLFESARRLSAELSYAGLLEFRFYTDAAGKAYVFDVVPGLPRHHRLIEMVTGLDLIKLQLQIAAGEALPESLQILEPRGHAMSSYVITVDTDPEQVASKVSFAPAPQDRVRAEVSATIGARLPSDDWPLIAKVTTYEPVRHLALLSMDRMLAEAHIEPFQTNVGELRKVISDYSFRAGQYDSTNAQEWAKVEERA